MTSTRPARWSAASSRARSAWTAFRTRGAPRASLYLYDRAVSDEDLKFAVVAFSAIFFVIDWFSGSSRGAIVSIIGFFVVGGLLLTQVDVAEGQRLARAEEAEATA